MNWSEHIISRALAHRIFNRKYLVVVPNCTSPGRRHRHRSPGQPAHVGMDEKYEAARAALDAANRAPSRGDNDA